MRPLDPSLSGVLLVDKPTGMTSARAVSAVKRALPKKTKIGHTGTLDPLASGLLVLMIGRATRLSRYIGDLEKAYTATAKFGAVSDSLDADGEVTALEGGLPRPVDIEAVLPDFTGEIEQVPPMASAIKVGGKRLYALHREGKTVEREARTVEVREFSLKDYDGETGTGEFFVRCGGGTYVRSLVADVAESVGSGAYLTALRRESVGEFGVGEAVSPEGLSQDSLRDALLGPEAALAGMVEAEVEPEAARLVGNGRPLESFGEFGAVAVWCRGELLAVYRDDGRAARAEVVLCPATS
ncbi:MAG: tRNA pseudouridine(55) synthase TruB [Rubrobacter sp.]